MATTNEVPNIDYHRLLNLSHYHIYLTDKQGKIIYSNAAVVDLLGYSVAEFVGIEPQHIIHPDDLASNKIFLQNLLDNPSESLRIELRSRHKNGHYVWIESIATNHLADTNVTAIVMTNRDITELKSLERKFLTSEAQVQDIVEDQVKLIYRLNTDYKVTFANNACMDLFSNYVNEIPGANLFDLIPIEEQEDVKTQLGLIAISNPVSKSVYRVNLPDNSVKWYEWTNIGLFDDVGKVIEFQCIGRYITDPKKQEQRQDYNPYGITPARQFLQATIDAIPANLVVLDTDGKIINVNAEWCQFADKNGSKHRTYYLGTNYLNVCKSATGTDADDAIMVASGIEDVITGQRDNFYFEYPCHSPDAERWFNVHVSPFSEDTPRRVVVAHMDITKRKLAELAVMESEERFRLIADHGHDMIIESDNNDIIQYISPAAKIITNNIEELIGKPRTVLLDYIYPDDIGSIRTAVREANATQSPVRYEYRHRIHDSEYDYIWLDVSRNYLIKNNEIRGTVTVSRDITERKLAEQELAALYRATSRLFDAENLQSLAQQIVESVVEEFDHVDCGLLLVDNDNNLAIRLARSGQYDVQVTGPLALDGDGLVPLTVSTANITYVADVAQSENYLANESRTQSELVIPLITKQGVIAVLDLQSTELDAFDERDQRILTAYAERAAFAIETMQLYERVNQQATDLKQRVAERTLELQTSKEQVEAILNSSSDGILTVSMKHGIEQVNQAFRSLFGETTDSYFAQSLTHFIHENDHERLQTAVANVIAEGTVERLEATARKSDGSLFYVELGLAQMKQLNNADDYVVCTIRDITEHKQAETALRESEKRFRSLVEVAPVGIINSDADGCITLVNTRAQQMFGYKAKELVGQHIEILIDNSLSAVHIQHRLGYVENPHVRQMGHGLELFARHKDGRQIPVEIQLSYVETETGLLIMSFILDITDRKNAEATLRESEEKYRNLIETMRGGVAMYDTEDRFTYVNDRFCEMMGYTRGELIGEYSYELVNEESKSIILNELEKRERGESSTYEAVGRHKNGQTVYILISGTPLYDQTGKYNGSFAVMVDITIQKHAEAALRKALEREQELNELKSRFVSMASHEFRTPLAAMLAMIETLSKFRHRLTEDEINQRLQRSKEQITHLRAIMEDILLLSRVQAGRVEFTPGIIDLDTLCSNVIEEFQSRTDIKHTIDYICSSKLDKVRLDKKLMRQIVNNLISNAIKYSSDNSVVSIHLHQEANNLILVVRDEGIGIPKEDLKHLFQPFHRASNVATIAGTGLGLVITKEAVELHGGSIDVESVLNKGTTFTVRIPLV